MSLPRKLNDFLSRTRDDTGGVSNKPTTTLCLCSTLPIPFANAISTKASKLWRASSIKQARIRIMLPSRIQTRQTSTLVSPTLKQLNTICTPKYTSLGTRQIPKKHSRNAAQSYFKTKTLIYVHGPKNVFFSSRMEVPT